MHHKHISVKAKSPGQTSYCEASALGVMPSIRHMDPGEERLYPFDYQEAVKTACCLLRQKEGIHAACKVVKTDGEKYFHVKIYS